MYTTNSIVKAFKKFGFMVKENNYYIGNEISDEEKFERMLLSDLKSDNYDFVFTINYSPIVSKTCYKSNCKYVSWTYDTPMNLFSMETLDNPNNYVFIFDNAEYQKYKREGLDTVYYLPLATGFASDSYKIITYDYEVSFLGNLYRSTYPYLKEKLDEYHKWFLDGIITSQRNIYGSYFILDVLKAQESEIKDINRMIGIYLLPEQLSYSLAAYITYLDRLSILSIMSRQFNTALVTDSLEKEEIKLMSKLTVLPKKDYYNEMPEFFRKTKINLNPQFRAVWSAIPQRALDIMSSGGFLLSGYTEELAYYFENGKELILYDSIEDAVEKAYYYLKNDEIREEIKKAGYRKTNKYFTYENRIKEILQVIDIV